MRFIYKIIVLSIFLVACDMSKEQNAESTSAGVVVHGCDASGWVRNNNRFPVRVKKVYLDCTYSCSEQTESIEVFQPTQKMFDYISRRDGYHVFSMDGAEIGWIRPYPNGRSESPSINKPTEPGVHRFSGIGVK